MGIAILMRSSTWVEILLRHCYLHLNSSNLNWGREERKAYT